MKRFLIQIAVFFALVAVIDVCCGFGFDYLKSHAKGGDTYKNYYLAEKCEDDVLILGSSRAARHYVPSVIKDSLGLSCYNAGEPGCGIIPAYARYKMVSERHKPKLVIYEVTPGYDYFVSDPYSTYLGRARQYYHKESVKELYSTFGDGLDKLRFLSNMYKNNSSIVHNVMDQFTVPGDNGYEPLFGVLSAEAATQAKEIKDAPEHRIDTLKLKQVEKLIIATKEDNVPMVFIISPRYNGMSQKALHQYDEAISLARRYSVPFINVVDMEGVSDIRELFQDFGHMNHTGAIIFTQKLVGILKDFVLGE